jgi:hypothetical protein
MGDITRVIQKFVLGRGDISDIATLHSAITVWMSIKERIKLEKAMEESERNGLDDSGWENLDRLMTRFDGAVDLAARIRDALPVSGASVGEDSVTPAADLEEEVHTDEVSNADNEPGLQLNAQRFNIRPEYVLIAEFHSRT